jgi:UDP-N-acetylmuramyl pentapeptide phosphotransferase/UDP-N-acetylglucosamine-1-phosphate transferase
VLGFLAWNWPRGLIFLGDSGAYLLGFLTVCIGLLLVKTEARISPMAPVLLGAYPLIETLWSIYRRSLHAKRSVARPDALHLHSLIYRRLFWSPSVVAQLKLKTNEVDSIKWLNERVNAWVSPLMLFFFLLVDLVTCLNYQDTALLLWILLAFIIFYLFIFSRLVNFKTPMVFRILGVWLKNRKPRPV